MARLSRLLGVDVAVASARDVIARCRRLGINERSKAACLKEAHKIARKLTPGGLDTLRTVYADPIAEKTKADTARARVNTVMRAETRASLQRFESAPMPTCKPEKRRRP